MEHKIIVHENLIVLASYNYKISYYGADKNKTFLIIAMP